MSSEPTRVVLKHWDLSFGDLLFFAQATGSSFYEAIRPRPIMRIDEPSKCVVDPEDDKGRCLQAMQPTMLESLGMIAVAMRQADRDNESVYTVDHVKRLRVMDYTFDHEWDAPGTEVADTADPTDRAGESTENAS